MADGQFDIDDLRLADGVNWQRIADGNEAAFIYAHDVSGQYFRTDFATHLVLSRLAAGTVLSEILRSPDVNKVAFIKLIPLLVASGLLTGNDSVAQKAAPKQQPLESRLLFAKSEMADISATVRMLGPVGRAMFSRGGLWAFAATWLLALVALAGNSRDLALEAQRVMTPSPETMLSMAVMFWIVKLLHELGHGLALARVFAADGRGAPVIRAGIGLFFLMPYPFTNASAAWLITCKWRRALVGAGGMYVEGWIAAVSALAWASIGDGTLRHALFELMVVTSISTLLFNLNPLMRLDGYFIMTDIMGWPNLMTRATQAARAVGITLLTGQGRIDRASLPAAGYWFATYLYRWITFTAILIAAFHIDVRCGFLVLAVTASTLILRPLLATIAAATATNSGGSSIPLRRPIIALGIVLAALLVPFDDDLVVVGRSEHRDLRPVYAETTGTIRAVAGRPVTSGAGATVVEIVSPELGWREAAARAELETQASKMRHALAESPESLTAAREAIIAAEARLNEIIDEQARARVVLAAGETWHADPNSNLEGAWTTPGQRRVLGVVFPQSEPQLKAEIDQDAVDFPVGMLVGKTAHVRVAGRSEPVLVARIASVLEMARTGRSAQADARADARADAQPPSSHVQPRTFEITLVLDAQ